MKLAHLAIVTPRQTGLYESAREIVAAERQLGHDAWIVDPSRLYNDRNVPIGRGSVNDADVIVSHSGLNLLESVCKKPIIHCLHGRPESSFRLEMGRETRKRHSVYTLVNRLQSDTRYKAFVTFWPQYKSYWELLLGDGKVDVIPAPVDLGAWRMDGPAGYQFGGKRGAINCVIADLWREDKTPYHCIHGFVEYARKNTGAKLHIYGIPNDCTPLKIVLSKLDELGILGEVRGMIQGLDNVYRAANVLISPHRIATRAIREAMACGCPVVHTGNVGDGCVYVSDGEDLYGWSIQINYAAQERERNVARETAERLYDSRKTAEALVQIAEQVCDGR